MNKTKFYHYFSFFAYIFFIISIISYFYIQKISIKPIEVFSQSYNYVRNNVKYYDSVNFNFDWGNRYYKYANKVKQLNNNLEVYKYINKYFEELDSTYIGCFDIDFSKKYKEKNDLYKIIDKDNKGCYIKIVTLWNESTVNKVYEKIKYKKNLVIDFRGTKHGLTKNWIRFFSIFLGQDIVWKKISYSANPIYDDYKFSDLLNIYNKIEYDSVKILIDNKTASLPITFISEILVQKIEYLTVYSNTDNYKNTLSFHYVDLKNGLVLYYPSFLYKNSLLLSIDNFIFKKYDNFIIDKKIIKASYEDI